MIQDLQKAVLDTVEVAKQFHQLRNVSYSLLSSYNLYYSV